MPRVWIKRLWNKTTGAGVLFVAAGIALYLHSPSQVIHAADWIMTGLLAICGRDAFGKLLILLAALADEGKRVEMQDSTAAQVEPKT
jgi:hypothetical protein